MKNGRPATQSEKNYALRRVVYNVMVGSKSLLNLANRRRDFADYEGIKITALIIARNLNEFFFYMKYRFNDDIRYVDFKLPDWTPEASAELKNDKKISKICGHIVSQKPPIDSESEFAEHFASKKEIIHILMPLIKQAARFINCCIKSKSAKYTGNAQNYKNDANTLLPIFQIEELSD